MKMRPSPIACMLTVVAGFRCLRHIGAFTTRATFSSHKLTIPDLISSPLISRQKPLHSGKAVVEGDSSDRSNSLIPTIYDAQKIAHRCLILSSIFWAVIFSPIDTLQHDALYHDEPISSPKVVMHPPSSFAAEYTSLSPEQKAVAEAWRIVDNSFLDRTFNNQDWFKLRQDYVYKKKYKTMDDAQKAVEEIVSSLGDKYTRYLPPSKYKSIVDSATGTLAGVGVQIGVDTYAGGGNRVFVADLEPNSPASLGGLQRGDTFLEVDGSQMNDGKSTPDDVAAKLRGPVESKVGVVVDRGGEKIDFILTRKPITITSVRSYISPSIKNGVGKVGVIRIKSFSGTTASTVAEAIEELKKKGAQALILDVHGNPGGLLPGGTDTASLFLDTNKPLVFVVNNKGAIDTQYTLNTGSDVDIPLAIYTDGSTASAAEVMTAALKENGRAMVVGKKTFGKGIIQTIRQLSDDNGGVAITVARYETPKHNDINKNGIDVDIDIDCNDEDVVVCIPSSAFKSP